MKLFKNQPVVSLVALAAAAALLICSTVIQIVCMDLGIALSLVRLLLPLVLAVGCLYLLRNTRITRYLQDYPLTVIFCCFCVMLLLPFALSLWEVTVSLYPVFAVLSVIIFSVTTQAVEDHCCTGCWMLWFEMTLILLLAGLAKEYEVAFAVTAIGIVLGIAFFLRAKKSVLYKIGYVTWFCLLVLLSFIILAYACGDPVIDFVVDRLFALDYHYLLEPRPSLEQYRFVGASEVYDSFNNILVFGARQLGAVTLIVTGVLMLIVIVCSVLLLKRKEGFARYLHMGATAALTLSFVGNMCYACGVGNLFTNNAAFANANPLCLIGDAVLLIIILRHETFLFHRAGKNELIRELRLLDAECDPDYDFTVYTLPITLCREELVGLFSAGEDAVVVREGDLVAALEGKQQCTLCHYAGENCDIEDVFRHLTLTADACFVKMFTGANASPEELSAMVCELLRHLPEQTAVYGVTDVCEEGECLIYILAT